MAVEFFDVVTEREIEAAARLTSELVRSQPVADFDELAERAIRRSFCPCVIDIQDAIEGGVSGMHAALVDEVKQRARLLLAA